eukprot:scaffold27827_cov55-Cyclotella_meneghiniana.AAC.3
MGMLNDDALMRLESKKTGSDIGEVIFESLVIIPKPVSTWTIMDKPMQLDHSNVSLWVILII